MMKQACSGARSVIRFGIMRCKHNATQAVRGECDRRHQSIQSIIVERARLLSVSLDVVVWYQLFQGLRMQRTDCRVGICTEAAV